MVHKSFDQKKKGAVTAKHPASLHTLIKWTSVEFILATFNLIAFYLVQAGHVPGTRHIGNAYLVEPAGSREDSRGSAEQRALDSQGNGSGTWVAPRRQERKHMLAEVQ